MKSYEAFKADVIGIDVPWNSADLAPKDGTTIIFLCGKDRKGEAQYDIGQWVSYKNHWAWSEGDLEGEWNTEFGRCDKILGWRFAN